MPQPLLHGLLVLLAFFSAIWVASVIKRDASIIDIFWGLGFVVAALVYTLDGGATTPRAYLVLALVTLWGVRLGGYIFWRARGKEEDYRYRAMREARGPAFAWQSLFVVFWLQAVLCWLISFPLYQAIQAPEPERLVGLDYAGIALFAVGFYFEAVVTLEIETMHLPPYDVPLDGIQHHG